MINLNLTKQERQQLQDTKVAHRSLIAFWILLVLSIWLYGGTAIKDYSNELSASFQESKQFSLECESANNLDLNTQKLNCTLKEKEKEA